MSISTLIGTHVLSNAWMNTDSNPLTNAPGHAGLSQVDIFDLSANSGSSIVRVPLSLRDVVKNSDGSFTLPTWQIDSTIGPILADAAARSAQGRPIKVILELGETPAGMSATDFANIAGASRAFVDAVYKALPAVSNFITAWEIGNEPNEHNIGLYKDNPTAFADYVSNVANSISTLEPTFGPINVVVGAIAYNDVAYMQGVFNRLGTNPNIDGFAIHPYTYSPQQLQIDGAPSSADYRSKRPSDWTDLNGLHDNNDFQGAVYNLQQLMNDHGYGGKGLWITEVGVPSWTGFRNAGPDGRDDQGRWIAEALGTLDSWDNQNLKSVVIHSTLDYQTGAYNDRFNIFDTNPNNNNDGSDGEGSFGLFERLVAGGPITAKAAAYVVTAYEGNLSPPAGLFPQSMSQVLSNMRVAVGSDNADTIDFTSRASGSGLTNGWIGLGKGGNDTIKGSVFDDSLFGADGADVMNGNAGNDRIFGGAGRDVLSGDAGNDDLYGNTGDDLISGGTGTNRVDGGTGYDALILQGRATDYTITGDGRHVTVAGLGEATEAWNVEELRFTGGNTVRSLANADPNHGNGLSGQTTPPIGETLYQDVAATQWLNGAAGNDVFVIHAPSSGYSAGATQDGLGIVVWNGPKFDILTGFDTLRFDDRDVKADASGRFLIEPGNAANYPAPPGENLQFDTPQTQWVNGVGGADVFVYSVNSAGFQSGPTQDGKGVVVWNGAKFDILTGFETLRFPDKDVKAGPNGLFDIQGTGSPPAAETVILDIPNVVQHLTGTTAQDVFKIDGISSDYGVGKAQDGVGTVVWRGAQFDVLHGFETLRFNDHDVPLV